MQETNRNEQILLVLKNWLKAASIDDIKNYIKEEKITTIESNSLYSKCILDLKNLKDNNEDDYIKLAIKICDKYLDLASGKIFYKNKIDIERRKEKYKQLNITLLPQELSDFKKATEKNNVTMKSVIKDFILEYIEKNK